MSDFADNLAVVRERIAWAAEKSGRAAHAVRLVAVTKSMPVARVRDAIDAGLTEFGENRVQEAAEKFSVADREASDVIDAGKVARNGITLHLIGSLQRNKARQAAELFDCVHSVDRVELVQALDRSYVERQGGQKLPVLIQVNLTGEESKSGVPHANLTTLADSVLASDNLRAMGLMTIARLGADERELRHTFAKLRYLLDDLRHSQSADWKELSMGMSDDYEVAIEEGATMIRLGRALFGARYILANKRNSPIG